MDNDISDSREWDLVMILGSGNCYSDNVLTTQSPEYLQDLAPCDGSDAGDIATDVARFLEIVEQDRPESADYETYEFPSIGDLPGMDDPEYAPAEPQVGPPTFPDLAAIGLPDRP